MKVLMLGWELPPYHVGGMGIACAQLCKHLANQNVDIEFLLPYRASFKNIDYMTIHSSSNINPADVRDSMPNIYHSTAPPMRVESGISDGPEGYNVAAYRLVYSGSFDILHAHDWLTFSAGIAAKRQTGLPLVVHVHATEFDRAGGKMGSPEIYDIEYSGFQTADRIIAVSQHTKDTIVEHYNISPHKIEVAHNSIDVGDFDIQSQEQMYRYLEIMKQCGWQVVLQAGRMTIQKGVDQLLRAMVEVIRLRPRTLLVLVGSGDQYNDLVSLAADLGISKNVVFVGYLNGTSNAWRQAFSIADVFVMPSVSEPFGLVALEAANLGIPTVISKQSGVAEVLRHSLKYDFWDRNRLVDQLCALLSSAGLRHELGSQGLSEAKNHSWSKASERVASVYRELVGATK
jgi:glycogen synthase